MRCADVRRMLMDGTVATSAARATELDAHLAGCADCRAFAARREAVRAGLRAHQFEHVPDAAFAARVTAALPGPTEVLGWAAMRLLPAALALALLVSWYGATRGPSVADVLLHPDDPQVLALFTLGGDS